MNNPNLNTSETMNISTEFFKLMDRLEYVKNLLSIERVILNIQGADLKEVSKAIEQIADSSYVYIEESLYDLDKISDKLKKLKNSRNTAL